MKMRQNPGNVIQTNNMCMYYVYSCIHLIQKRLTCSNSEYYDRNELWDVMKLEWKHFAEK